VKRFTLQEHSEHPVDLDDAELDAIEAAAAGRLTLRRLNGGSHALSSSHYVGVLVAGGVQITVQPKIALHNLFLMLGAGSPTFAAESAAYRQDDHLLDAMSAVFASSVERATRVGVLRGYKHMEERLVAPRGRIDITAQIRRPGTPSPVACTFDEYTSDILENRVLLAALERLLRMPELAPRHRAALMHLTNRFDEVARAAVDPTTIDRWRPTRLNHHYEEALRLAAVVLRDVTLRNPSEDTTDDEILAPSFMVNMNDLFQDFVADRLRRALSGVLDVGTEPTVHLGRRRRLAMKPDLVFSAVGPTRSDPVVYVGDAKYKLSNGPARMSDYYQLLAYSTALSVNEGVLVYAQRTETSEATPDGDGDIQDVIGDDLVHTVEVVNTDKRLHVYRLPLSGSNDEVEAALVQLANWIRARVAALDSVHRSAPIHVASTSDTRLAG